MSCLDYSAFFQTLELIVALNHNNLTIKINTRATLHNFN